MRGSAKVRAILRATMKTRQGLKAGARVRGCWEFVARGPDGQVKWRDEIPCNLVVDAGLNYLLDVGLSNGSQISAWYVLLTDGTPTVAAGDTMASHAGWVEVVAYSEGVRQTWTDGGVSGKSVDNSASKADFSINGATTVGGAALCSDNTKSGSSGTLYAAGAFSGGDKSLGDGDTLSITGTFTMADDGA